MDIAGEAPFETGAGFAVGDILGRSLSLFQRNFAQSILLCGMFLVPDLLVSLLSPHSLSGPTTARTQGMYGGHGWDFVTSILQTFAQVTIISGTFARLKGQPAGIADMLRQSVGRFRTAVGVVILQAIGVLIGSILLIVPGLILLAMLYLALPVCVIEQRGVVASLNRSAALTKGHRWPVFGLLLVASIGIPLIAGLIALLALRFGGQTAFALTLYAAQLIYLPFSAIVGTVLYQALRTAKEGPGIEMISEVFA